MTARRRPLPSLARLLNVEGIPHAFEFALLQGCFVLALAVPATVVPLLALELLGGAQGVSAFYLVLSIVGLGTALATPLLIDLVGRRRAAAVATLSVLVAACLFPLASVTTLLLATALYTFGFFVTDITLNVAILEHVPRRLFARFEPLRMACLGAGFTLGPWLGVQVAESVGLWAPFAIMAVCAMAATGYLLGAGLIGARRGRLRVNPLRFVPRFAAQPRLRLAFLLAACRSAWWNVFFIYAPIYCVQNGLAAADAGLVVSLGGVAVIAAPLWGRLGAPLGMRRVLALGYGATGVALLAMSIVADSPEAGVALLILACVCASWLDAVGNAPFLRAVRPLEREAMTSVYTAYRDVGRIAPQGLFSLLLLVSPLSAVFAVTAFGMFGAAWLSRHIPRRY